MASTRRTQPLRKKLRQNGTATVINMTRGAAAGGYNPQDAKRGAAKGTGGVQAPDAMPPKRRGTPSGPKAPPSGRPVTPLPMLGGERSGTSNRGRRPGGLGQALRKVAAGKGQTLPGDRPRTNETTRGKRRLTFEEAYARRTTDSSRARAEELYGKTATAEMKAGATSNRSLAPGEAKLGGGAKPYAPKPKGGLAGKLRGQGGGAKFASVTPAGGGGRKRRRRRKPRSRHGGWEPIMHGGRGREYA